MPFHAMPRCGVWLAAAALLGGVVAPRVDAAEKADTVEAAGWPLHGALAGEVELQVLPELGLVWRLEADAAGLALQASRPGVEMRVRLRLAAEGAWRWEIERGRLDLAELWPLLRERLGEQASGWSASGRVELAGDGTWSPEAGTAGELRLALREGWARSDELEAELSGLELDVATRDLAGGTLPAGQTLRVGKVAMAGAELAEVRVEFGVAGDQILTVAKGDAAFLGGRVRMRPFTVSLLDPAVTAAADVDALQLSEAARLLPWLLQTAQGRLRGRVELSWDSAKGLRVRDGGLQIVKTDDAAFRLAPSPGLLTGGMPAKFPILPWRWARGIGLHNPARGPLKEIEMGREGLRIETFQVKFWPDGAGRGRTAAIHIVGRPTSGKLVREVKLDLNFHGPWSEFLAFGLNNELSGFSFRLE